MSKARMNELITALRSRVKECRDCAGTGQTSADIGDACHECGGIGWTLDATPLLAEFPELIPEKEKSCTP